MPTIGYLAFPFFKFHNISSVWKSLVWRTIKSNLCGGFVSHQSTILTVVNRLVNILTILFIKSWITSQPNKIEGIFTSLNSYYKWAQLQNPISFNKKIFKTPSNSEELIRQIIYQASCVPIFYHFIDLLFSGNRLRFSSFYIFNSQYSQLICMKWCVPRA